MIKSHEDNLRNYICVCVHALAHIHIIIWTNVRQCPPAVVASLLLSMTWTPELDPGRGHRHRFFFFIVFFLNATPMFRSEDIHSEFLQKIYFSCLWSLIDKNHEDPDVCGFSCNNNRSTLRRRRSVHIIYCHNITSVASRNLWNAE